MELISKAQLEALTSRTYTDAEFSVIDLMTTDTIRGEVGDRITDPPQPGIASVALGMAARVLVNSGGVSSEQAGGMLISYFASQIGQAMSFDERRRLRRAVGMASGASSLNVGPEDIAPPVAVWRAI
ncbi:hypothetical protein ACGFZB_28550 [Streptomyces cinerochromogenes]|uniref:Uncharacterized protein n=1 Tax=Streptomyces cinerochromogenes TaxID=66422 RepID=A0ABW7BEX4_9ACTN